MTEVNRYTVQGVGVGREDYSAPVLGPLAEEMRVERRSTTSNDNGIANGTVPALSRVAVSYRGKYYPRGCRGMTEQLQIYCVRAAAGTMTLRYSPHPGMGPIGEVIITPGVEWAWVAANIEEMWNYDSIFIWISTISVDVSWAYDVVLPYDGHQSTDTGATWLSVDSRPFIRIPFTGETAGDVPISGIVNNIPIPNVGSVVTEKAVVVPIGVETDVAEINGAGYVDLFTFTAITQANTHLTFLRVLCDDRTAFNFNFLELVEDMGMGVHTPNISVTRYERDGNCVMMVNKRFEFRRKFVLQALNNITTQSVTAEVFANLMR